MNKLMSWIFIGALLGVPASVLAADGVGAGIVKGTITIGGKPAKDAVVSIEGLSQDQIKTKMAHSKSWHNVYSKGGANDFDLGLYPPGKSRSKKFDKPGVSRVLCNAHPNMEAFIVVKDHPFFSTTDSRGNYEIKDAPLGKLRVEIWSPNLDVRRDSVEIVRDGEVFALSVELKK
jgi:hypothetical protein